ncbi:hypothetical protein BXZ70DRAFT_1008228 [Cristinia sonorae]|uniref:Uncharacterized protein n=1 Tax=Cristinia sonorae TaxID=1940300 RepID=A0A8K0XPK2_9AGAR|nr:hypothetical protein BXZ70DRAFT_1008228 [Cristinia sonorae]
MFTTRYLIALALCFIAVFAAANPNPEALAEKRQLKQMKLKRDGSSRIVARAPAPSPLPNNFEGYRPFRRGRTVFYE